MYLEKLKIFGFKSFAKKTELKFMPGMTGVVGPNGCGKSNIVDSIRWVLGEQKAGTLRSDKMESVIFNGSKNTKPLGMAEVSLVIQNTRNVLPVEYSEVVITRRLFRSGESQYLLNNNPCRLKDINDLLMDTGLAPDAYSVIELKMVETILNGKPEDRRRIFEEAVGITKYKQRRKLTLKKLEATEQDLIRLADIIGEVESKVNSLHRQVRRAQRYQELTKDLKDSELRVANYQFAQIYNELTPLMERFENLNRDRESFTSEISFKQAEVEALHTDLIQLEQQLKKEQEQLNSVNRKIHSREEEILLSRERLKAIAENKTRIQVEIKNLKDRIVTQKDQLVIIQEKIETTKIEIDKIRDTYSQEKDALDTIEKSLAEKRTAGRAYEQKVLEQMRFISEKQRNLERLNTQLENLKDREKSLINEKQLLTDKIALDRKAKDDLQRNIDREQSKYEGLVETQSELEIESENQQEKIEKLKNSILMKVSQVESKHQRIAFLKELLESYADYPEGIKHLMLNYGTDKGFRGTFADVITVDEKHRKAVEAALGDMANYLIVENNQTAYVGIDALKESENGIVTFLPIENLRQKSKNQINLNDSGIVGWADEIVKCENKFSPAVKLLLGSYLVVEDFAAARRIAAEMNHQGIHLVTKNGEMLLDWGGIKGGKKKMETESIIGRQDQYNQLKEEIEILQKNLRAEEQQLKDLEMERVENGRQKTATAQMVKNIQEQLSKFRMEFSQIDYRIKQSEEKLQQINEDQLRIKDQQQDLLKQQSDLNKDLEAESQEQEDQSEQIRKHQTEIESLENQRNEQAAKVNLSNLKLVELTGNERNLDRELEQTRKLIEDNENGIKAREQEFINNDNQKEQLEDRIDELSELLSEDYSVREQADEKVNNLEQKANSLRETIDEKSKNINKLRNDKESASDILHNIELRISELRLRGDNVYRRILEEYDIELKKEEIDPDYNVSVDEEEIESIKMKVKNLGPVNLLALKEYEQEKERLDFLVKQQEDLLTAEQNLKDTIDQLNDSAQEKFDSIFQEIRQNFIRVFKGFFPNGDADLVIVDGDDPLEAVIDIKANPKGKRMEALTLLSGGEKALTAISLLFGIYLVKPSPICILDEVDAPLDDTNVDRFLKTIKTFSDSTQFIMVTHNKITMKSADCLYGVTMEETGVSKIVSVKLE